MTSNHLCQSEPEDAAGPGLPPSKVGDFRRRGINELFGLAHITITEQECSRKQEIWL